MRVPKVMRFKLSLSVLFLSAASAVSAQITFPLYNDSIPNSRPTPDMEKSEIVKGIRITSKISRPTITIYLPSKVKANGTAVIICPGGGYWVEAASHEGSDVARKFNEEGITAFVLKYRLPDDSTMVIREIGPLQDAQRAIQFVRENARTYHIRKNKIGIMGFSAGGHLASTAGTHFTKDYIENPRHISLRPDFMLLIYPVTTFSASVGEPGTWDQLLGKNPSEAKIKEFSNELHVTDQTPPAFLVQAKDDPVKYQNSTVFAAALQQHGVPAEVYLYEKGGHGYGMNNKMSTVKWMDLVEAWLIKMKFMKP